MSQIDERQMLTMGTVLDHRYRIVRYLASGGFGNTYVAEDTRLGGQVAVKEFFMRGTNHRSTDGTTVEVSNDTNAPVLQTSVRPSVSMSCRTTISFKSPTFSMPMALHTM